MQFIKTSTWDRGNKALIRRLKAELKANKRVLWLVPGGSNINACATVMAALPDESTVNLAIMLTDERYGPVGHQDSNWLQLQKAGFVAKQATAIPVLVQELSLEATRVRYEEMVERAIDHADVVIAQFGIGADGHIAGILPQSAATKTDGLVAGYEAPPFTRLTLTFEAIKKVDAAYAFVFGQDKAEALTRLKKEDIPLDEQPSQILKQLSEAYVYNNQIGGKV